MPVPHGDKGPDVFTGKPRSQGGRQRLGLGVGHLEQRRLPAQLVVDRTRRGAAALRDEPRQQPPHRLRNADDGRIVEQVEQERLDGLRAIRTPQIE